MTFREKWAIDNPESIPCTETCPHHAGYEVNKCHRCGEEGFRCDMCWDREIPEAEEPKETKEPSFKPDLNALIERAATKKDISVSIFITGDSTHISVYPCPDPSENKGNPVAEAYKLLLHCPNSEMISEAIKKLEEALE